MQNKINTCRTIFASILLVGMIVQWTSFGIASATSAPSATAKFTATDGQYAGSGKSWYSPDIATQLTDMSPKIVKVQYSLNGTLEETDKTSASISAGFSKNATKLPNGTYHLTAIVTNDNGQTGQVTAMDGKDNLTWYVNNGPSAQFTATSDAIFGNSPNASGKIFLTQLTAESGGIVSTIYYLNGVEAAVNTTVNGQPGFEIDATTLANGTYSLTATVQDADGNLGHVTRLGGAKSGNNVTFIVDNSSSQAPSESTASTTNSTCGSKQANINTITTRIVNRSEMQLQTIDSVVAAVQQYYTKNDLSLANYQQITGTLSTDENNVQSNLLNLVNVSVISCDSNGKPELTQFKGAVTNVQSSITNYIGNVKQLIQDLEKL